MSPPREPAFSRRPRGPGKEPILLSPRQLETVAVLRASGVLSVSEIADALGVSRSSATLIVEQLVQLGVVDRRMDPEDRRRRQVRLAAAWLPDPAPGERWL